MWTTQGLGVVRDTGNPFGKMENIDKGPVAINWGNSTSTIIDGTYNTTLSLIRLLFTYRITVESCTLGSKNNNNIKSRSVPETTEHPCQLKTEVH